MCNFIEHTDNYSKTFGVLWKYCREEPALNDGAVVDWFTIKEKTAVDNSTKNVKIMVPLKVSN